MRKCFLHIGTYKTGTTSLQNILSARYDELQRHGFLYPRAGRGPMDAHHNISMELSGGARFRPEYGAIEDVMNEIQGSRNDIVISSEDLCATAFEPGFKDLVSRLRRSGLDVFFVVYLRNQIDFIRSAYFELLKGGSVLTLDRFFRTMLGDPELAVPASFRGYHELLDHLGAIKDTHLLVYSYDEIRQVSVIPHFLSILGLTPEALGIDATLRLNTECALEEQFSRFYENRVERPLNQHEVALIGRIFSELDDATIDFSARTINTIIETYAGSNHAVFASYGIPEFRRMRPVKPPGAAGETICLEDIFSAEAQFFVHDLAATPNPAPASARIHGQEDEKARRARLHHSLISRHHAFAAAFDSVTALAPGCADRAVPPEPFPRKPDRLLADYPLAGAYNGLVSEYATLAQAYTDLLPIVAERETLLAAHDRLVGEREALLGAHDRLIGERCTLLDAHDRLIAEREALLDAHNRLIPEREYLLAAHNRLIAEREALLGAHDGLIGERDALLDAHNRLVPERDALLDAYNRLVAEREALLGAHDGLIVERDTLLEAHNRLLAERGALLRAHHGLIAERDRLDQGCKTATETLARTVHQASVQRETLQRKLDAAIGERDALLASRSWRLTAPLRALRRALAPSLKSFWLTNANAPEQQRMWSQTGAPSPESR